MINVMVYYFYTILLTITLNLSILTSSTITAQNLRIFSVSTNSEVRFNISGIRKNCNTNILGSSLPNLLRKKNRFIKVFETNYSSKILRLRVNIENSAKIANLAFFQAINKCPENTFRSNLIKVKIRQKVNSKLRNVNDYLLSLREKVLQQKTLIKPAFNGVSFVSPVDLQSYASMNLTYIVEQTGKIISVASNGEKKTVLDLSNLVSFGGEKGLLGLAFHPDFKSNGFIYVNYTRSEDGHTVISRFTVDPNNTSSLSSQKIILTIAQPFDNHNGGGLAFGPDGYLYVATGDGGSGGDPMGNAQNLQSLLGKILRIDVNSYSNNYIIPADNPFFINSNGEKQEIFAYGFRNPWRISFSGNTLWVGDVGQSHFEEINIIQKGGNFGWNTKEGPACFNQSLCNSNGLIDPINSYGRNLGGSVTGGYVPVPKKVSNLNDTYIFGDFVSGRIFALENHFNIWQRFEIIKTNSFISSFGIGIDGEVYFLSYFDGKIYQIKS